MTEDTKTARFAVEFVRSFAGRIDIPDIARTEALLLAEEAESALDHLAARVRELEAERDEALKISDYDGSDIGMLVHEQRWRAEAAEARVKELEAELRLIERQAEESRRESAHLLLAGEAASPMVVTRRFETIVTDARAALADTPKTGTERVLSSVHTGDATFIVGAAATCPDCGHALLLGERADTSKAEA
jgi:hypothetical protein